VHDLPKDSAWTLAASILADIVGRRDDAAAAAALYDDMLPFRAEFAWQGPMCRGPIAHSLGVLTRTIGDYGLAAEHFAEADAINTRTQAPFFQARNILSRSVIRRDCLTAGAVPPTLRDSGARTIRAECCRGPGTPMWVRSPYR
jgi:hypothetical protein